MTLTLTDRFANKRTFTDPPERIEAIKMFLASKGVDLTPHMIGNPIEVGDVMAVVRDLRIHGIL